MAASTLLPLTTVARMQSYGEFPSQAWTSSNQATLSDMINSVSRFIENYCSRYFMLDEYTEARRINSDFVPCRAYPVTDISSVLVSYSGKSKDLNAWSDYEISINGKGINVWGLPRNTLVKYTYTGGLATDTASIVTDYPDLENACRMQVLSLWKRHTNPDKSSMTLGTGETQWTGEYNLLKNVEMVLEQEYLSQVFL